MNARYANSPRRARQRGVALVVALVLLLIVTLLAVGSMRGTGLQERMSANMYDRSLAFQRAEASMRAAESAITTNWRIADLGGVNCTVAATVCPATADAFTGTANWTNAPAGFAVNASNTPGTPQYLVQFMGTGPADAAYGVELNADYGNYGNPYPPDSVAYYRVTTRSSDPAVATDRSVVVLQSTYRRAF